MIPTSGNGLPSVLACFGCGKPDISSHTSRVCKVQGQEGDEFQMQRMRRIQLAAPVPGTRKARAKVQRWAGAATRMRCVGLFTCLSLVCHPVINLVPGTCLVKCSRWKERRMGGMRRKGKKKDEGGRKQGRTERED